MPRRNKIDESYEFLTSCERESGLFSLVQLCEFTGWRPSTPRAYFSKKWSDWITKEGDQYRVSGLVSITEDEYRRHMSQVQDVSRDPSRPSLPESVERLVVKARQSAILALDVYNRPATEFRTEGYIVLMVVAWTALLHAIFERDSVDYIYRDQNGDPVLIEGDQKALALIDCLRERFGEGNPPVRRNLGFIIGLRNKIEHRYVPGIDARVAGECQALLLNFERLISEEFGGYFSISDSLSVPLQTSTLRDTERTAAIRALQANHYDEVMEYVVDYRRDLPDSVYSDPAYSFRVYLIPKIGNHESSSDISFEFVKYDSKNPQDVIALQRHLTLIRDRQIPVANPGMHKPGGVAKRVAERIDRPFSVDQHTRAWKCYEVRASGDQPDLCATEFCQFDSVHKDYIYTDAWVDLLVQKLSDPAEYKRVTEFRK